MGYRYIGSKVKIIDNVLDKIVELAPVGGTIVDLMSGTGIVSSELRKKNYSLIANDLMTYSYHHSIVNLKFHELPKFECLIKYISNYFEINKSKSAYENVIDYLNELKPIKGYFWKEFSLDGKPKNTINPRNYFSVHNAQKIDSIRLSIKNFYEKNLLLEYEYSLLIHDLIMAANDIANIAGTYGHYMARLSGRALSPITLKPTELYLKNDTEKHLVLQGYAEENAKVITGDLCYIDPPYMKRQYAANYHILETLARGDEPEAIGVSGLRPWRDQYSNFCTKTKIRKSFDEIFTNINCNDFLISYSEDGLLSIDDFRTLLTQYGKVDINEFKHKRFRSNNSSLNDTLTEYLIHLYR